MTTCYGKFFRVVAYPESNNIDTITKNLESISCDYVYILHDKDIESITNNEIVYKKSHWHLIIWAPKSYSNKMIAHCCNVQMVYTGVPVNETENTLVRYLLHLDEPINVDIPKTRYSAESVHCCNERVKDFVSKCFEDIQPFDIEQHLTEEESLFQDLIDLNQMQLTLQEFLCKHTQFIRYFASLEKLYKVIFGQELFDLYHSRNKTKENLKEICKL